MYYTETNAYPVQQEKLKGTLWRCAKCDSLVSIHSARVPDEPLCPTCFDSELEFFGLTHLGDVPPPWNAQGSGRQSTPSAAAWRS